MRARYLYLALVLHENPFIFSQSDARNFFVYIITKRTETHFNWKDQSRVWKVKWKSGSRFKLTLLVDCFKILCANPQPNSWGLITHEGFYTSYFFFFLGGGGERWHDNEGVPITFDQDCNVRELLPSFCANKWCICIFFVAIPSTSERWMLFVQRTRRSTTLLWTIVTNTRMLKLWCLAPQIK